MSTAAVVSVDASKTAPKRFDYVAGYRDPFFLVLWLVHLIIMVALAGAYGQKTVDLFNAADDASSGSTTYTPTGENPWVKVLIPMVITCAAVGVFFSFCWILAMRRWGGAMVYFSFAVMMAMLIANAVYAFGAGITSYGIVSCIIAAFMGLYLFLVRNRIPFTQAVMSASSHALLDFPASIWLSYIFSVLQIAWLSFWIFAMISIAVGTKSATGWGIFFAFCSLYWTAQIIANISHTTTAGMVASWWFQPGHQSPTLQAFKRATTTSLGSIALGSLIVAGIQALHSTLRCLCSCGCYRCFAGYIERIIRYFNMYTFSYVAIYGQPFIDSANSTISLFSRKGFTAIINDSLVGTVIYVGGLIGGCIAAFVSLGWVKAEAAKGVGYYDPDFNDGFFGDFLIWFFVICGAWSGLHMTSMSMTVFQSAVATTFVVWADDAPALAGNRPEQYKALADGANKMYGQTGPGYAQLGTQQSYPVTGGAPPGQQVQPGQQMAMVTVVPAHTNDGQPTAVYAQPVMYAQPVPAQGQPHPQAMYAPTTGAVYVGAQVSAPVATPGVYVTATAPAQI